MTFRRLVQNFAVSAIVFLVRAYQVSKSFFLPPSCRFHPTSSAYAIKPSRESVAAIRCIPEAMIRRNLLIDKQL
jgi:putative component of membrane protein insertase Oxa1/YidC/SpoIIIJ protein YidD